MKFNLITRIAAVVMLAALSVTATADIVKSEDIAGVYHGEGINFTLAAHPQYPGNRMIGMIIMGDTQKVCAVTIKIGAKGVSGIVYDGALDKQLAIAIKVDGDKLTFTYKDGTKQELTRIRNEQGK